MANVYTSNGIDDKDLSTPPILMMPQAFLDGFRSSDRVWDNTDLDGTRYKVYANKKDGHDYVYIGGKWQDIGETPKFPEQPLVDKIVLAGENIAKDVGSMAPSGGSSGRSSGGVSDAYYVNLLNKLTQEIDELKNPKVWTADELAELYGVQDQYDYNKILQMYNDATNDYYTSAIAEQNKANVEAMLGNNLLENKILNDYNESYKNVAPTYLRKAMLAGNILQQTLKDQSINEAASVNLNNLIRTLEQEREDTLANNPIAARSAYNDMGTWLLSQGTSMNTADVQNYINNLNAYETRYTGIRNAQNNLASTSASAYGQRAQAALTNATNAASNSMWDIYKDYYGPEGQKAVATAYANAINNNNNRYQQTTSAK